MLHIHPLDGAANNRYKHRETEEQKWYQWMGHDDDGDDDGNDDDALTSFVVIVMAWHHVSVLL